MDIMTCPNCGDKAELNTLVNKTGSYVSCTDNEACGMAGPTMASVDHAVRWWNRMVQRVTLTPLILRSALEHNDVQINTYAEMMDSLEGPSWRES